MSYLLISREIRLVEEEENEEEEEAVVVMGSIDVPHEALGWVVYWFLV